MKQFITVIFLLLLPCLCLAQEQDSLKTSHSQQVDKNGDIVFSGVGGTMPSFPGHVEGLLAYLQKNIKYPRKAEKKGIEGKVVCSFWVLEDGSITDVRVEQHVDPALDKKAIRVIKAMPKWNPGTQNGIPTKVRYTLPVTFKLQ